MPLFTKERVSLYFDDTIGIGNPSFANEEERKSKRFDVKEREDTLPFRFNGCDVSFDGAKVSLHQTEYAASLKKLSPTNFTDKEFSH